MATRTCTDLYLGEMERERGKDVGIVYIYIYGHISGWCFEIFGCWYSINMVMYLVGALKYVLFSSLFGEMIQFDKHFLFRWVETSN